MERQIEARRRQIAAAARKLAPMRLLMASQLEKAGRIAGSLEWYRLIARDAPDTDEGRSAVERISILQLGKKSP